jgi:tetratricopeptide (TPR) repeat protein
MAESSSFNFEQRLRAAEGYVELGMMLDAAAELEEVAPERRGESRVLALRLRIYSSLHRWLLAQTVARTLAIRDPDNVQWAVSWAYATRRVDSINVARIILIEAVERLPGAAILHYNLACYECQLGDVEVAKARLKHAIQLDPIFRAKALDDET